MTRDQAGRLVAVVLAIGKREALREWLDRPPPAGTRGGGSPWRQWFDGEEYLGQRSARTGPDPVGAAQRCECGQCRGMVAP